VLERPLLQRTGHEIGHVRVERLALHNRLAERRVRGLWQSRLLRLVVEGQRAKRFGRLGQASVYAANRFAPIDDALDGVTQCC
jgi:hypothetical protein